MAPGVFTPSAAVPILAAGPPEESKFNRLELEELFSGGIRVVVDVYMDGERKAYNNESKMPMA
jgi:hypothetical protein